jgi:hypothetical protein
VIMPDQASRKSRLNLVAASAALALLPASHALAARAPAGGPGTASALTQLVMGILVYGTLAAVIGVAARRSARQR